MQFVTDRASTDVMLGTDKGSYNASDLNRVESNSAELDAMLQAMGTDPGTLVHKTDWGLPGAFSAAEWPTTVQMERYLGNVRALLAAYGVSAPLPDTMEGLTYTGANQIEEAQQRLLSYIDNTKAAWAICGAAECGG